MTDSVENSTAWGEGTYRWLRWKRITESIRVAVIADVAAVGELSEPEITVLSHLRRAGGSSRQNALVAATGWDRTRLSHLITRMAERGYLSRTSLRNGVQLTLEPSGAQMMTRIEPLFAAAINRHLTSLLTPGQVATLDDILDALSQPEI